MIRIGTRSSALAVAQSEAVRQVLLNHGIEAELATFDTKGDQVLDRALDKIGDKGLFTTELEMALRNHDIDMAVHSLKDLPTQLAVGLTVAAYTLPEDARDVLIAEPGTTLAGLPAGAVVGTSSLRRAAFLREQRPDIQVVPVRGNLQTRVDKWRNQKWAGLILAAAGVHRLRWHSLIAEYLDPEVMVPAPGQGVLAVEMAQDHRELTTILNLLNDPEIAPRVVAERQVLATLAGGCQIPLGSYATLSQGKIFLTAKVASRDGQIIMTAIGEDLVANAVALGHQVGEELLRQGAHELIAAG
ncbi:MAG: hydroxymethylbilane synthase [Sulfobacillus benefaciens]|uniref:Porphobilinogen deaminase n=1 Tax=Sulfobacillus benefaciens TaxID=453960 RepID=A0A2T2XK07_9FIRM|nr:MAG: hydroxymethylbilane synthase [Sulfobacillus benefaciens]